MLDHTREGQTTSTSIESTYAIDYAGGSVVEGPSPTETVYVLFPTIPRRKHSSRHVTVVKQLKNGNSRAENLAATRNRQKNENFRLQKQKRNKNERKSTDMLLKSFFFYKRRTLAYKK